MSLIAYTKERFRPKRLAEIEQANAIIAEYQAAGYQLTLRQLYYQFVARDLLANTMANYKSLGRNMTKARMGGLVSWDALHDNNRDARRRLIQPSQVGTFCDLPGRLAVDLWSDQDAYIEVWVEKDALSNVISKPANKWGVTYLACKGFLSSSEMHEAAKRFAIQRDIYGKRCVLIHLGDHDPSGLDMTRDNATRLQIMRTDVEVHRIALNMDQVHEYGPPPNPAKTTDSRYAGYVEDYGEESWELDALEPAVIDSILSDKIESLCDVDLWDARCRVEDERRDILRLIEANAQEVIDWAQENL